jgi:hypothetical protein
MGLPKVLSSNPSTVPQKKKKSELILYNYGVSMEKNQVTVFSRHMNTIGQKLCRLSEALGALRIIKGSEIGLDIHIWIISPWWL